MHCLTLAGRLEWSFESYTSQQFVINGFKQKKNICMNFAGLSTAKWQDQ